MIVEIRNFGPIEKVSFDLSKDMHLLYGKNSVGKSYAMYVLYCVLKAFSLDNTILFFDYKYDDADTSKLANYFPPNLQELPIHQKVEFTEGGRDFIIGRLQSTFQNTLFKFLQESFPKGSSFQNGYTNQKSEIELILEPNKSLVFSFIDSKLKVSFNGILNKIAFNKSESGSYFQSVSFDDHNVTAGTPYYTYGDSAANLLNYARETLLKDFVLASGNVYFLPASRGAIYDCLNTFAVHAALNSSQQNNISFPKLRLPVRDYFINLATSDTTKTNSNTESICEQLENEILEGKVYLDPDTKEVRFIQSNINLNIKSNDASSLVEEIAPLVVFLRNIIIFQTPSTFHFYPNDEIPVYFLVEEPESFLHPETQIKLMQVFSDLSKLGVKIILASHSDTMLDKLSNCIIKDEISPKTVQIQHIVMSKNGSIDAKDMMPNEEGIDDNNFTDAMNELFNERAAAYRKAVE